MGDVTPFCILKKKQEYVMNSDTNVSHTLILESFGMTDFKRPHNLKTRTGVEFDILDALAALDFKL